MSKPGPESPLKKTETIPWPQRLMERPFLLLGLGLFVMFLFYTIWGWYEVISLPPAPLP